jgi:hypothetical protein
MLSYLPSFAMEQHIDPGEWHFFGGVFNGIKTPLPLSEQLYDRAGVEV